MPDPIKDLYNSVKSNGIFVDESDFRSQLTKAPKDVYSTVSDLFVDYNDFENVLGFKKKVGLVQDSSKVDQNIPTVQPSSQEQSQLPLASGGPSDPISDLLKKRKKIVEDQNAIKPAVSYPGMPELKPRDFNAEITSIDDQLSSKGIDPKKIASDFNDVNISIPDEEFVKIYTDSKTKPQSTDRQVSAIKWHNALRTNINNDNTIGDDKRQQQLSEVNTLIESGSSLPSQNFDQAIQYGKNAYDKILELTANDTGNGDLRKLSIENFKKDFLPVLGNILIRDKAAISGMKNLALDLGNMVDEIFSPKKAEQTRGISGIDVTQNQPAQAAKEARRSDVESTGLSILSKAITQEYEDGGKPIADLKEWDSKNGGRLKELIGKVASLNPEDKALVDQYNKEKGSITALLGSREMLDLKDQESQIKSALNNYSNEKNQKEKNRLYDIYTGEVDKYNLMLESSPNEDIKNRSGKLKSLVDVINSKVLPESEINEFNGLISEYKSLLDNANQFQSTVNPWVDYIRRQKESQYSRYPSTLDRDVTMAEQEWKGEKVGAINKLITGFGNVVENAANIVPILYDNLFATPDQKLKNDFERLGLRNQGDVIVGYQKESNRLFESPLMTVFSDNIKSKLSEIDNNTKLSESEKENKTNSLLKSGFVSGDIYKATNPNAGNLNLTASSVLNTFATVAPQFLASLGITAAIGGGAGTLFLTTAMQAFSPYYDEAISKGISTPVQYATALTLVDAATELIGTADLNTIKKVMSGKTGFAANFFKDLTDLEFKKLMAGSKGAFKNYGKAIKSGSLSNTGESVEGYLAAIAGNEIKTKMFNDYTPVGEGAVEAFVTTQIGSLPLNILGVPLSVNQTNIGKKFGLYNAAVDLRTTLSTLESQFKEGKISSDEYNDKGKAITEYSNIIRTMPKTYEDGRVMKDDDRVKYAFNQFIATRQKQDGIPPSQETKINEATSNALLENDKILQNATQESKVTEGLPEGGVVQPTRTEAGQPQEGQGEGGQGQGEVTPADVSNRPVGSEGQIESPLPKTDWAIITGTQESVGSAEDPRNVEANNKLEQELIDEFGADKVKRVDGMYENVPQGVSFLVSGVSQDRAMEIGLKYNQQSVLYNNENVFSDGSGFNPYKGKIIIGEEAKKQPAYSVSQDGTAFSIDIEFDKKLPMSQSKTRISKALSQAIPMATKSLENSGIKFQLVNPQTDTEAARSARGNQGLFISEDGTIIIDESKLADEVEAGLVVWHEASHPVMNIIRNTNKPLYDGVVRGLNEAAKKNKGVSAALNWAQSQPEYNNEDTQNDEAIVETIGRINAGLIDINSLDTGLKQKLIEFINNIAKAFGIKPILNDTDIAAFKKTVSEVADALKTGRDIGEIVGQENVMKYGAPSSQPKAITVARGSETLKRFGLPTGRNTTRKIGEALEARTRDKYGIIGRNDRSESALKKISSWMSEEVKFFINEFGENSGKGWYGEKFQKGIDAMSKIFPELGTDQDSRDLFTMLVAITSDGTEVMQNFKQASMAYQYYKDNGNMPEVAKSQRAASYVINFNNIQRLLKENDGDIAEVKRKLLEVTSIAELNKTRRLDGLEDLKTSWPASFKVPLAAGVFGPKLGMFYANLSGMENYPTLDRWWSRTFNRYRGTLIPQITRGFNKNGEALGIDAYRQVTGLENASEDEVLASITRDHDSYENKGFKDGTVAEKKANTLYKKLFIELNDSPFGRNDRKFMYDAFIDTKKKLKASGVDVTIADIQAILWYFEKNLYKKLGVTKPILGISYEDAANSTFDKWSKAGKSFDYSIDKSEEGETIEEIDELTEGQPSVGKREATELQKNEAAKTQGFFSDVVKGLSDKYKPIKEWVPVLSFDKGQEGFKNVFDKYMGNFDLHIATSIPTFRETQVKVGNAIVDMYKSGLVYDLGGSEGGFVKAITESSDGKIKTINLDPNPDMKAVHEATPVKGSDFVQEAFLSGFEENGITYETHTPKAKADVVHESMMFQFITPEREAFIREVADKYLKKDGLFITEEKLSQNKEEYDNNEKKKAKYKDEYYTKEQQAMKSDDVLVGMKENQADIDTYKNILKDKFKYVEQYWDSGNFKGFVASNSESKVNEFMDKVGSTESEFTTTPLRNNEQASVGRRTETDLGTGKEKTRGLAKRFEDLPTATSSKIEDEAIKYFERTNKQTKDAVLEFMDGKSNSALADFVVSNPDIDDVSLVWMAAEVAKNLTKEIDQAKGDKALIDELSTKQARIYNQFAKKATSLGQAVQAFVAFSDDPNATKFMLNKIIKQLKDKGMKEVSEDQIDEISNLLDNVSKAKEGLPKDEAVIKLSHYLAGIAPVNGFEILQAIWYAKILSGVTTQSKNLFANLFNTSFELVAASTVESLKNKSLMPYMYAIKGLGGGFAKGAVKGLDILLTGVKKQDEGKYFRENALESFSWGRTKLGKAGKILDFPLFIGISPKSLKMVGRALSAADAVFSSANQEAMANMLAWAQASKEGKTDPTINNFKRANEILGNTKKVIGDAKKTALSEGYKVGTTTYKRRVIELVDQARPKKFTKAGENFGQRVTLNFEPEGFTRPVYDMVVAAQQKAPVLKMWIPFTRIVANLSEQMINYSPLGFYRAISGKRNPFGSSKDVLTNEERGELAIKAAMGLTAVGILSQVVGDDDDDWFDVTANGTGDMKKNYELQKGGWRPYTITLKNGEKINYADWPIRGLIAGVGAVKDAQKYSENEMDFANTLTIGALGFTTSMYESSLMKGLADFIDIFRPSRGKYDGIGDGLKKWSAQQAKSVLISNFTQQGLKMIDEYQGDPIKEAKGAEIIYRDIPVINDGLNPIIDVFGDPVKPTTSERLLPYFSVSDDKKDKLIKFLNDNKIFVGVPAKRNVIDLNTEEEVPMTDKQYYDYKKLYGQKLKSYLYEYLDEYKGEDAETIKTYVGSLKGAASAEAESELFYE